MVLTERQRTELHHAVLDYLQGNGFETAAEAFSAKAEIKPEELTPKTAGLLEKKWTSIVRLQKKVMELENKLGDAVEEIKIPAKLRTAKDKTAWIPRPPAKAELTGHRLPVTCVKFHPVFSVFVTGSEDSSMKIWDYESGEYEKTLKGHTNTVQDLAFDSKGTILASSSADMTIRLWDFEAFECSKILRGHDHNVSSVCFTPSDDHIVSASRDKTIKVWEVSTGYNVKTVEGHEEWVRRARVDASGQYIVSCSNDHSVKVWGLDSGDLRHTFNEHTHVVENVAWAPPISTDAINAMVTPEGTTQSEPLAGPFFASVARDKLVKIFDASTGACLVTLKGHDSWVRDVLFHPGGKLLLTCADDKTIRIWDLATKRCTKTLQAHNHFVNTIDMHPSAPYVVSGSVDQTTKIWECR
eukprot:m.28088 g.28088  ORF g.28088 m.28088 type:complete len:412 (-) comp15860_c0_seq1:242-1477(-)